MSLVALIPARGGSKGIPRKNLALCGGRSLLDWTAEAALHSGLIDRVVLSTDDSEIAEAGRALGLDVPFLRPADLAGDAALMLGVMQHCLIEMRRAGEAIEAIVLLQPTSPFRRAHHEVLGRRKQGFLLPIRKWMRYGRMRDELLDLSAAQNVLDVGAIRRFADRHQAGTEDLSPLLWSCYVYLKWQQTPIVGPLRNARFGE